MCVWIGRFVEVERAPRAESRVEVQEGAKRGVSIGVIRVWLGSMELMWEIVASVSAMACEREESR